MVLFNLMSREPPSPIEKPTHDVESRTPPAGGVVFNGGKKTLAAVRTDATVFFGVRDRQERDKYEYFLEFDGKRITDTSQTLGELLGPHRRKAELHLVEQITPGSIRT